MNIVGFIGNLFEGPSALIILVLALLFFGAKRLPELARGLGTAINEFNKAKNDVQRQLSEAVEPPPAAPQVAPHVPQQIAPAAPVQAQVPPAPQPQEPQQPQPPVSPSQSEQKA